MTSPYDAFAWFYQRYWSTPFQDWQAPALRKLLLSKIPAGATLLDLCCGTGELSARLSSQGFAVTGLDSSEQMLACARRVASQCLFIHSNAADFALPAPVDAAVCTFDSLNHILRPEELLSTFRSVHDALKQGGIFVFDVNTGAAYGEHWNASACEVAPDHAFFLRGGYDPNSRTGTTRITMFRFIENWQRADVEILQRPWEVPELDALLREAGFHGIDSYQAKEELGMNGHYGEGRVYFSARP